MNREWMADALCRGVSPDTFFPEGIGIHGRRQAEQAILICRECPVRRECGEYRKATHSAYGVWGGRMHRSTSLGVSGGGTQKTRGVA